MRTLSFAVTAILILVPLTASAGVDLVGAPLGGPAPLTGESAAVEVVRITFDADGGVALHASALRVSVSDLGYGECLLDFTGDFGLALNEFGPTRRADAGLCEAHEFDGPLTLAEFSTDGSTGARWINFTGWTSEGVQGHVLIECVWTDSEPRAGYVVGAHGAYVAHLSNGGECDILVDGAPPGRYARWIGSVALYSPANDGFVWARAR